jgi:hypothetical protein
LRRIGPKRPKSRTGDQSIRTAAAGFPAPTRHSL